MDLGVAIGSALPFISLRPSLHGPRQVGPPLPPGPGTLQ